MGWGAHPGCSSKTPAAWCPLAAPLGSWRRRIWWRPRGGYRAGQPSAVEYAMAVVKKMAVGQNPVPPVNIPTPTKIGSLKWVVNSPTNQNGTLSFDPKNIWPWGITYGSISGWMNIHLPPILTFTRCTGSGPTAICQSWALSHNDSPYINRTPHFSRSSPERERIGCREAE